MFAGSAICSHGARRIVNGDVVLTYSMSSLVERILLQAHSKGTKFRTILVDARPKLEGKVMLRRLVRAGLECSYVLLPALGYVMTQVSKVLLGAHSMLANGVTVARVGTAMVGAMACENNVPVLVCCETYKFSDVVQVDSFNSNELGDPDELIATGRDDAKFAGDSLQEWRDISTLKLLNLTYDVMPSNFVRMVLTDSGEIPPTAIPVIIREYHDKDSL